MSFQFVGDDAGESPGEINLFGRVFVLHGAPVDVDGAVAAKLRGNRHFREVFETAPGQDFLPAAPKRRGRTPRMVNDDDNR
jgi:hypothetical protein